MSMFPCRMILLALLLAPAARAETIRVGVAISLREAMEDIAESYHADNGDNANNGDRPHYTFGSSGQIAAQIKNGADIDVFISAANEQVDELAKEGLVVLET